MEVNLSERAIMCHILKRLRNIKKENGTYKEWLKTEMQCKRYIRAASRSFATKFWRDIENAYKETQLQNPSAAKPD